MKINKELLKKITTFNNKIYMYCSIFEQKNLCYKLKKYSTY
jgi:hypothetical protein